MIRENSLIKQGAVKKQPKQEMTKDGKRCPSSFSMSGEGNTFSVFIKGDSNRPTEHMHGKLLKNDTISIEG